MANEPFRSHERRVFLSTPLADGTTQWDLDSENAHYLTRVLRLEDGHTVDLADGSGRLYQGTLARSGDGWQLVALRIIHVVSPRPPRVLAAALIKGDRWEWMLEKAAEIGADRIVPIEAERSVVSIPSHKIDKRLARWQKILDGAARQCERLGPVRIDAPCSLANAIEALSDTYALMLDEAVPQQPWPALPTDRAIGLFVGPEGGWTDNERRLLLEAKVIACGLGDNLLRAETAAIAALTLVRAHDAGLWRSPE